MALSKPCPLDHDSFPDIVDNIIEHADRDVQLAFRQASRTYRDRVDTMMCRHIVMSSAIMLVVVQTLKGDRLPCIRCVAPSGDRIPGLRWTAYSASERARFLSLLGNVRHLELTDCARIVSQLDRDLIGALSKVDTVHAAALDARGRPCAFPFRFRELRSSVTLQCQAEMWVSHMRWRQPPIAEAVLEAEGMEKWAVDIWFDPDENGLAGARIHLAAPESVREVVIKFRALAPGDLRRSRDDKPPALGPLGMLSDVVRMVAAGVPQVRYTLVLLADEIEAWWLAREGISLDGDELYDLVLEAVRDEMALHMPEDEIEGAIRAFSCVVEPRTKARVEPRANL